MVIKKIAIQRESANIKHGFISIKVSQKQYLLQKANTIFQSSV